jgi:hypothetical protein
VCSLLAAVRTAAVGERGERHRKDEQTDSEHRKRAVHESETAHRDLLEWDG